MVTVLRLTNTESVEDKHTHCIFFIEETVLWHKQLQKSPTYATGVFVWYTMGFWISNYISLKFVRKGPCNWWYSKIGSDNGLAPSRRQVIIWTNGG